MSIKQCLACKQTKPLEEFGKEKKSKDGRTGRCKLCLNAQKREAYKKDPEKYRAISKENYYKWRGKKLSYAKAYAKEKPEVNRRARKRYYQRNTEKAKHRIRECQKKKPWKVAWYLANRRMRLRDQSCDHANCPKQIKEFYKHRPDGFEVDHIVPLSKGGAHCIENLQYLTVSDNREKGARVDWHGN